jgi:hypothetical protein
VWFIHTWWSVRWLFNRMGLRRQINRCGVIPQRYATV